MAIQKNLVDQATNTHLDQMTRVRLKMLDALNTEWRVLEGAYKSANKSARDKIKAINKDRNTRRNEAYSNYRRTLTRPEGGSYTAYLDDADTIDSDCQRQIDEALEDRNKTCQAAEEQYQKRVKDILEKYKDETNENIDKFVEAHP